MRARILYKSRYIVGFGLVEMAYDQGQSKNTGISVPLNISHTENTYRSAHQE